MIVQLPSVVVVLVVVSETCAHAKGAATAKTMLSNIFFIVFPFLHELIGLEDLYGCYSRT